MIEGIKDTLVRPWVCSRVKALVAQVAGVHFADKGKSAIKMSVPCDRPDSK